MLGIILAGGKGTRLGELTKLTNKHLLPVGDVPMIYHPIRKLVEAGIRDILIVSGIEHMGDFVELLGSGKRLGCSLSYKVQDEALGIANALALAEKMCDDRCVVVLGDNIFEDGIGEFVGRTADNPNHAAVAIKSVKNPTQYGNIDLSDMKCRIVEKPKKPLSEWAVTGLYSYPKNVFEIIKTLSPSDRGEYEITDVNNYYSSQGLLICHMLKGYWLDAGTMDNYHRANKFIYSISQDAINQE